MIYKTSAEMLESHIAGRLIAGGADPPPQDVIVQIFTRNPVQDSFIVPAVAEPLIVWILRGAARVEELRAGGYTLGGAIRGGPWRTRPASALRMCGKPAPASVRRKFRPGAV